MSIFPRLLLATTLHSVLPPASTVAAPGDPDLSFLGTGWVNLPGVNNFAFTNMTVQSDGGILLIGNFRTGLAYDSAVYRFLSDGTLDLSFNGTGSVVTAISAFLDDAYTLVQQPDGKLLVGGLYLDASENSSLWLMRLLPDGSLDPAFGGGQGYIKLPPREGQTVDGTRDLALQKDGKILASSLDGGIYRFLPDGAMDENFGVHGFADTAGVTVLLAMQKDGKILGGTESSAAFTILRLNTDGTPDLTFAGTGSSTIIPFENDTPIRRVIPLDDGRILAVADNVEGPVVARLLSNGSLDTTFNFPRGWTQPFPPAARGIAVRSMVVQQDGRILLAGSVPRNNGDIALARLLADGTPDPGFNSGAAAYTEFNEIPEYCLAASLLPDGKLLCAGYRQGHPFLIRYQTLSPGFSVEPSGAASPVDFGLITVGSRTKQFTVFNGGPGPLTNIAVSLTGETWPGEFTFSQSSAQLAPAASSSFLVTFTPGTAHSGPRNATLRITSSDAAHSPYNIPLAGTLATPSQIWRVTWFASPDNSGAGADLNDFDGDGMVNLLEYATASHPHLPSLPAAALTKNGDSMEFIYTRSVAALTELNFAVEAAASPAGPWLPETDPGTILTNDGIGQTVKVTLSPGPGRKFARLRVSRR